MANQVKEKIQKGQKVVGTFFHMGGAIAAEALGIAGLDFLLVDTEHAPFDVESTTDVIRAAELRGITPMVRVKDITRPAILKMLDIGAKGLVIPCVRTVEEVQKIVEYGKYAPIGSRGFIMARAAGYGYAPIAADGIDAYMERTNEEVLILPQCETKECLEKIEEIAAIPGVDGIFIGPYDLTIALGKPAQFSDPEVKAAFDRILKACRAAGKFAFIFTGSKEAARSYLEQGFDAVTYNSDVITMIEAYQKILGEIKGGE